MCTAETAAGRQPRPGGMLLPGVPPGPAVARLTVYLHRIAQTVIAERSRYHNVLTAWLETHASAPVGEDGEPELPFEMAEEPAGGFDLAPEVLSAADRHVLRVRSYREPLPYAAIAKVLNAAPTQARRLGFGLPQTERALVERCRRAKRTLEKSAESLFQPADLIDGVGLAAALRERRHLLDRLIWERCPADTGKLLQRAQAGSDPEARLRLAEVLCVGLNQVLCGVSLYDSAGELAEVSLPPALWRALTGRSRRRGVKAVELNRQIVEAAYAGRL